MYAIAVLMLIGVLHDEKVELYEAAILVTAYFLYIACKCLKKIFRQQLKFSFFTAMYFNEAITNLAYRLARCFRRKKAYMEVILSERQPLLLQNDKDKYGGQNDTVQPNGNVILDSELTLKDCEDLGV